MGQSPSVIVGFGIVFQDAAGEWSYDKDWNTPVYDAIVEKHGEPDEEGGFDSYEISEAWKKTGEVNAVFDSFGYDYGGLALMAKDSVYEGLFYANTLPRAVGPDGNDEQYQADLDKALADLGLGDLGLNGEWLILLSWG